MVNIKDIDVLDSINRYLQRVNSKFSIQKAYLYGSYAKGIANKESDIDLALVSSSFSGNRFYDNVAAGELTWGIDTRIEPVTFRPEEFNHNNLLASEILSTGIELKLT